MAQAMNDPTGTNATPSWGNIGQVSGCHTNSFFEVGDPLSGTEYPPITVNGHTYHLQEMALFDWFFDGWPPTLNDGIPGCIFFYQWNIHWNCKNLPTGGHQLN